MQHQPPFPSTTRRASKVEQRNSRPVDGRTAQDIVNDRRIHLRVEGNAIIQDFDMNIVIVQDHTDFNGAALRTREVIAIATRLVAMESTLRALVAGGQHLEHIEFAASSAPARAILVAVLERARDLGVQHPDCGHVDGVVDIGGRFAGVRHRELEEEGFLVAVETFVRDSAWSHVAAGIVGALLVCHDDYFGAGWEGGVLQDLRGGGAAGAVAAGVGERVAE